MTTRTKYVTRKADPKNPGRFWNYFRAKGVYTRLPDDPTSPEFAREYDDCLATLKGLPLPSLRTKHDRKARDLPEPRKQYPVGTIGWLIPHYVAHQGPLSRADEDQGLVARSTRGISGNGAPDAHARG